MKFPDALFHYTVGHKLPLIASSGRLEPKGFGAAIGQREKPVLWWSSHPRWEMTATKLVSRDSGKTYFRPSVEELHAISGLYRFRLETSNPGALNAMGLKLVPWTRLPLVARIDPKDCAQMVTTALELGAAPTDWWGCLEPVPVLLEVSGQLRLETLGDGGWEPVTGGLAAGVRHAANNPLRILQAKASEVPQARGL